ncbi:DUF4326 domain-containing protein [Desertimonas flava]|uniref:DUF4326 domain-containing protein n=1 Tax=Desertimonas flava TaxID=2064846 RepID=UPI000E343D75
MHYCKTCGYDGTTPVDRPRRIRLRRTKGWRKPDGAVVVARPSRWGNPFRLGTPHGLVRYGPRHLERFGRAWDYEGRISADGNRHDMWFAADDIVETYVRYATAAEAVELFRLTLTAPTPAMLMAFPSGGGHLARFTVDDVAQLAGHDLACWCPFDQPCHADVLLELANLATPVEQNVC